MGTSPDYTTGSSQGLGSNESNRTTSVPTILAQYKETAVKITSGKQLVSYIRTSGITTNHSSEKRGMVVDIILPFKGKYFMLEALYLSCLDVLLYNRLKSLSLVCA